MHSNRDPPPSFFAFIKNEGHFTIYACIEFWECSEMVNCGDVCTFGFLYTARQVAGPGDGPGSIQKAKSAKNA